MIGKFSVRQIMSGRAWAVEYEDAKGRRSTTTFAKTEAQARAMADELNNEQYPEGARSLWPNPFRA